MLRFIDLCSSKVFKFGKSKIGKNYPYKILYYFTDLCHTLLNKFPCKEKVQGVLSLILRLLTSAVEANMSMKCEVYWYITWPDCILTLGIKMLNIALLCLENGHITNDR